MAHRLPKPGGDDGTWGQILNDYLSQAHNPDGTLKNIAQSQVENLPADLAGKVSEGDLDTKTAALVDNITSSTTTSLKKAYGSVTLVTATGTTDSAAIMNAFNSMKVNGHATGTLVIKGAAGIDATLDFDGGFSDTENPNNWPGAGSPRFRLIAESLTIAPGIGAGLRLHGFYGANIDIAIRGGGTASDYGVDAYNLHQPDLSIEAINFAGIVLHGDTYVGSTQDVTRRIRGGKITKLHVSNCGQTLYWRGIEAFGSFEHIWDNNCVNGSYIGFCSDIELVHYENFSPASQTVGLTLEGCNNFNGGVIALGDRASQVLLKVIGNTADPTGTVFSSDLGSINRIRATCYQPGGTAAYNAVQFLDVHSAVIDNIATSKALTGVRITGSNVFIKKHHSYTSDTTALAVEGDAYNPAPIVEVNAHYRYITNTPVSLASTLTGGVVKIRGHIEASIFIGGGASSGYAITSASAGALDVALLTVDNTGALAGLTNHRGELRGLAAGGVVAMAVGTAQVTVSNTTASTTVAGPYTIPANSVMAGTAYRIRASGTVDNDASASVVIRCRIGGPTGYSIATPLNITSSTAKTGQGWNIDYTVVFRAAANAATPVVVLGQGYHATGGGTQPQGAGLSGLNMTVARDLVLDATWSVASATSILRCEGFTIEKIA